MKRKLALMLVVSLILSLGAFSTASLAADNGEIIITTGEQFAEKVIADNFGSTFIIEGTETLADGTTGIVIPDTYVSVTGFKGTLKGVEGKNNIQINKPLFDSFNGDTSISNINLKTAAPGDIPLATAANYGALVRSISGNYTYEIDKVANYCELTSSKYYVGGLIGLISGGTITVSNCSNHADITSTGRYVAGIVGAAITAAGETLNLNITKSFNAGDISGSRYTCGIIGIADKTNTSNAVSHCFNVGNLTTSSTNAAGGVAGIVITNDKGKATVDYCYNVGSMSGATVVIARVAAKGYFNDYSNNCYYIGPCADNENPTVGEEKTIEELANGLETLGFSNDVWEYVETDENNKYSLPQLKGNTFVTLDTTWYVEPVVEPEENVTVAGGTLSFSSADDSTFVPTTSDTGEEITTAYSVVIGRFSLANGVTENDIEYGMLISKTVSGEDLTTETCTKEVRAIKNVGGAYGILFYGNMTPGDTYYVRPYVKYNDSYTYGEASSFVFPE